MTVEQTLRDQAWHPYELMFWRRMCDWTPGYFLTFPANKLLAEGYAERYINECRVQNSREEYLWFAKLLNFPGINDVTETLSKPLDWPKGII